MKALVYTKTNKVEYLDYKDPEFKKDESIVKVSASGICGSDMHAYHGKDTRRVPPLILGHEISGTIEQGKNKGAKVIINPLISCGNCKRCNTGSEHLCPDRSLIGMNKPHIREGGLAEFVSVPDKNIYDLPSNLEIKKAAIAEPTAVSLHAVELGEKLIQKPIEDLKILIIGGGAIGLLSALILENTKNCKNIFLSEINDKRLNVCKDNLNAKVLKPDDKEISKNNFDLIVDAVGFEKTRSMAIDLANPGSVIVHAGLTDSDGSFDFRKITLQEICFVGTYCYTKQDFLRTIDILKLNKIGNLNWIEYMDLKNGSQAFKKIHDGTCASPKIILIP